MAQAGPWATKIGGEAGSAVLADPVAKLGDRMRARSISLARKVSARANMVKRVPILAEPAPPRTASATFE